MSFVQKTVSWVVVVIALVLQHHRKTLARVLLMISYNLGSPEVLFLLHLLFVQLVTPGKCTFFCLVLSGFIQCFHTISPT